MKKLILSFIKNNSLNPDAPLISLYGLGDTNRAVLRVISRELPQARISVRTDSDCEAVVIPHGCKLISGPAAKICKGEDVVFLSPSVRRQTLYCGEGVTLTSETDVYFQEPRERCIAVSGSDGKSTTASLTALMLSSAFPELFLGGNIGAPLSQIDLDKTDMLVLELSSFMLSYATPRVRRSAVTNITPNHLNWHSCLEEYVSTKLKLLTSASEPVINADDARISALFSGKEVFAVTSAAHSHRELVGIFKPQHTVTLENGGIAIDGKRVIGVRELAIAERHNVLNFMTAAATSLEFTDIDEILSVGRSFKGLAHRCEVFYEFDGVKFIDSSIDTSPERTRATLEGIGAPASVILGGRTKGLPLEPLTEPLLKYATRISVYGECRWELMDFLISAEIPSRIPCACFDRLDGAIAHALEELGASEVVLLSPAAASYGEFKSYKQRGNAFKERVRAMCENITKQRKNEQ